MPLPKIIRTKISPPRRSARKLYRPRLQSTLPESLNYRVTILQAAAGDGKSTALATLGDELGQSQGNRGVIRNIQTDQEIIFTHWQDAVDFIRRFVPLELEG